MRVSRSFRALAALVAMSFVAAACGDDDSADDPADEATTTSAGSTATTTATTGGSIPTSERAMPTSFDRDADLVFGYAVGPSSLDPHKTLTPNFVYPVYDRLTKLNDDLEVVPMLATEWEFADDGSYLEMTLRDDVTFHDGTPLDAAAVVASIQRGQTLTGSVVAAALQPIKGSEAVDAHTVRFRLDGSGAQLPAVFATTAGAVLNPNVIADPARDIGADPGDAGSGPYRAVTFVANDKAVYEQAQPPGEHWDTGAGLIKRFTWQFVPTAAQRINGVRSGDLDLGQITGAEVADAVDLLGKEGLEGRKVVLSFTTHHLMLRATRTPLDNDQIREAVSRAIDRDLLAEGLYRGTCEATNQFYPPGHWAHSDAIDDLDAYGPDAHDTDEAKRLIAASGVPNPEFQLGYTSQYILPAPAVQAQLAEVGIKANLSPTPAGNNGFRDGAEDSAYGGIVGGADPSQVISNYYLSGWNLMPEADRAQVSAMAAEATDPTLSQDERGDLYDQIFLKIAEGYYTVPICNPLHVWLQKGRIANLDDLMFAFIGFVDPRYLYAEST